MTHFFAGDEIDALRARLRELEVIILDSLRLEHLLDHAGANRDLHAYGVENFFNGDSGTPPDRYGLSATNNLLYADPVTGRIIDANTLAIDFLGYPRDDLLSLTISDLEIGGEGAGTLLRTYVETAVEEQVYQALYRHQSGHELVVHVYKRLLHKDGQLTLHYRLEDQSLHRRAWYELLRREQGSFAFQQRLYSLNKVTIELCNIRDFDALCRQVIVCAIEQLGFDRMGLWFLDPERKLMTGSYGVDETGQIREEHQQSWSYVNTYIREFVAGNHQVVFAYDDSPIYNERSVIIGSGWHLSAPLLHEDKVTGVLMVDNLRHRQPINDYDQELLRLYARIVGELTASVRNDATRH